MTARYSPGPVKHIDEAVRLMIAATQSDDPGKQVLLLGVASAWLELAKHDFTPTGSIPPSPNMEPPTVD